MNAIPPKGRMSARTAQADDHIHLTMSLEDDEAVAPFANSGDRNAETADAPVPEGAKPAAPSSSPSSAQPRARRAAETGQSADGGRAERGARDGILPQFAGIELSLTVEVGSLRIALKDLVAVEPGQLLALDRMTAEPVNVLVNGKPFARGEIVAVGDRYGVRLLEIVSPAGGEG